MLDPEPKSLYGVGIDAVSAQDAWGLDMPGFDGLKLAPGRVQAWAATPSPTKKRRNISFISPMGTPPSLDAGAFAGSRSCARHSADDIVTTQVRYDQLDQPGSRRGSA
jgi:spermidine dehydrogenase